MKRLVISLMVLLGCILCVHAYAEQDGLYTYQINDDNTVTITGFNWSNSHGDIYIPEMLGNRIVSAIGKEAFTTTGNTAVKITLPDTIRSIGEQAFRGVAITYVNIPLNTVEIGDGVFAECSVMRFNVANGHTVFATIENVLYNKQTKTLLAWPTNKEITKIPNGIKHIGDYAFYGRKGEYLSFRLDLPESIETIGKYAFAKGRVTLDTKSTLVIDDYAFYQAFVYFSNSLSLSRIGKHAFEESTLALAQKGLAISTTPYEIEEYAFYNSRTYDSFRILNATSIGAHAFQNMQGNYDGGVVQSIFLDKLDDFQNLTYLGEDAFSNADIRNRNSMGIHVPAYANFTNSELKSIPNEAFSHTVITFLKINPSVTRIGERAFKRCEYLEQAELTEGLLTIGDEAFSDCKKLTAISIPASVTMIGNDVFTGCADTFVVTVEAGSYGEIWARTCGYAYVVNGQVDDTSWLDD